MTFLRLATLLCLTCILGSGWPAHAMQSTGSKSTEAIDTTAIQQAVDEVVASEMARQGAVGVAVGIVEDGKVVYTRGYGLADRKGEIPVTTDTNFRWASISKPLTAIVAGQLASEGKLDLDADIRTYVPEFPVKDPEHPITTRQLLGHLGGIVHYINGPVIPTVRNDYPPNPFKSVILALDTFRKSPLVSEPGAEFNYSTHGYILASAVIERAGGKPFHQLVRERISEPLGLDSLQPDYQWVEISDRAVGYRGNKDRIVRSTNTDVSWKLGGGGFISNIDDLADFSAGLINPEFMPPELQAELWTPQTTTQGKTGKYGLGFSTRTLGNGQRLISHSGAQEKTRTMMMVYPDKRRAVVVMTNTEYVKPHDFANAITERLWD
ncbi:MAG: beta-lactamase family protein [Phycisphaerales bacterium]|nr:beta-lactamase family protein [Phycisphaerales bacterium]